MAKVKSANAGNGDRLAAFNNLILRSIVDHAVVTLDNEGIVTSWNEGAERILGWSEDEIVGRPADLFFTVGDTAANRAEVEMRTAIENGRAEDVRWHVRKNGEKFWGSGLMMPLLRATDTDGVAVQDPNRIDGFVKIFRDRTEERKTKLRLEKLQDRARLAMRRSGTVGVFDNDLIQNSIVADEICARLHSVDVEEAEGGTDAEKFFGGVLEEDLDAAREAFVSSVTTGVELDVIYRVASNGSKPIWLHAQGAVHKNEDGEPARLVGIVVDVTDQREQLRMQEARLEFADAVRDIKDRVEIAELVSRVIGETLHVDRAGHCLMEDDDTVIVEAEWNAPGSNSVVGRHRLKDFGDFASLMRAGKDVVVDDTQDSPHVDRADLLDDLGVRSMVNLPMIENGELKAALFVNNAMPRQWTEAEIMFLGAMLDRTYSAMDRLRLAEERDALTAEITHRMKNVLTLAQVVVKQSLQGAGVDDQMRTIEARLRALAAAQDVLTQAQEKNVDIRSVVNATLAPHIPPDDRIDITGPAYLLNSQQVIGLSLALHELATNAAKYGALSNDTGQVTIEWTAADDKFSFQWVESGGPSVSVPSEQGFGSTVLNRVVGSYFDGASKLAFEENGVRFSIGGQ